MSTQVKMLPKTRQRSPFIPLPAPLPPPKHSRLQRSSTRDIPQTSGSTCHAGSGYLLELVVTRVVPSNLARRGLCRGVA